MVAMEEIVLKGHLCHPGRFHQNVCLGHLRHYSGLHLRLAPLQALPAALSTEHRGY
jgi:hypothetical protein